MYQLSINALIAETRKTESNGETITMLHVPMGTRALHTEVIDVLNKHQALVEVNRIYTELTHLHPNKTFTLSVRPVGRKVFGFDKIKHLLCQTHEAHEAI
jgi:hypothetical protein